VVSRTTKIAIAALGGWLAVCGALTLASAQRAGALGFSLEKVEALGWRPGKRQLGNGRIFYTRYTPLACKPTFYDRIAMGQAGGGNLKGGLVPVSKFKIHLDVDARGLSFVEWRVRGLNPLRDITSAQPDAFPLNGIEIQNAPYDMMPVTGQQATKWSFSSWHSLRDFDLAPDSRPPETEGFPEGSYVVAHMCWVMWGPVEFELIPVLAFDLDGRPVLGGTTTCFADPDVAEVECTTRPIADEVSCEPYVAEALQSTEPFNRADLDRDGDVDLGDFNLFRSTFGGR
jgi:hypothetical protein